jgi:hypothetical protein
MERTPGLDEGVLASTAKFLIKFADKLTVEQKSHVKQLLESSQEEGTLPGARMGRLQSLSTAKNVIKEVCASLESTTSASTPTVPEKEWTVEQMIRQYGQSTEVDQKLAAAYARDPMGTIQQAIRIIRRGYFSYVPFWLGSLGADLAPYLADIPESPPSPKPQSSRHPVHCTCGCNFALSATSKDKVDLLVEYIKEESIYADKTKPPEMEKINPNLEECELEALLLHPAPCVRASACNELAARSDAHVLQLSQATIDTLTSMLSDLESLDQFGIRGPYELQGIRVHWRREVYLPFASAASVLIKNNIFPSNLLNAMLTATRYDKIKIYQGVIPFTFPLNAWSHAVKAAGGFRKAAPTIALAQEKIVQSSRKQYLTRVLDWTSGRRFS